MHALKLSNFRNRTLFTFIDQLVYACNIFVRFCRAIYLVEKSVVIILILLHQRRTTRVDKSTTTSLRSRPRTGGRNDRIELVTAPEPQLYRVADLQLVAVDIEPDL